MPCRFCTPHRPDLFKGNLCKRGNGLCDLEEREVIATPLYPIRDGRIARQDQCVDTYSLQLLLQVCRREIRIEREDGWRAGDGEVEPRGFGPALKSNTNPRVRGDAGAAELRADLLDVAFEIAERERVDAGTNNGRRVRVARSVTGQYLADCRGRCHSRANPGRRQVNVWQKADASGRHHIRTTGSHPLTRVGSYAWLRHRPSVCDRGPRSRRAQPTATW